MKLRKYLLVLISLYILYFALSYFIEDRCFPGFVCNNNLYYGQNLSDLGDIQISGWIPWWKEKEAYSLISEHYSKLTTISPVWFYIDSNFELSDRGSLEKVEAVSKLKDYNLEVIPTLASDLAGDELSVFLDPDNTHIQAFLDSLEGKILELNIDGVDVDLEGIREQDKENFIIFLTDLNVLLDEYELKLVVTVHAQTGRNDSEISKGQDLTRIAALSDEVRIMAYDKHGKFSDPGPISPFDWMTQVISYSLKQIPLEKIVLGLPSYGYIWERDGDTHALQFDEFEQYLLDNSTPTAYSLTRDSYSGELIYDSMEYVGWLSDSNAIVLKMLLASNFGINRFVIWSLGGMDNTLFTGYSE